MPDDVHSSFLCYVSDMSVVEKQLACSRGWNGVHRSSACRIDHRHYCQEFMTGEHRIELVSGLSEPQSLPIKRFKLNASANR